MKCHIGGMLSVAACCLAAGCWFSTKEVDGYRCSQITKEFFAVADRSPTSRKAAFRKRPLAEQYAIYICGNRVIHPPAMYLAEPFAQKGAVAVPLLKEKLDQVEDDLTVRDILLVFEEMSRLDTYDVAGDAELLLRVEQRVQEMTDPEWKKMAERSLSQIYSKNNK